LLAALMRGVHSNKADHQSIFDIPPATEIAANVRPKSDKRDNIRLLRLPRPRSIRLEATPRSQCDQSTHSARRHRCCAASGGAPTRIGGLAAHAVRTSVSKDHRELIDLEALVPKPALSNRF